MSNRGAKNELLSAKEAIRKYTKDIPKQDMSTNYPPNTEITPSLHHQKEASRVTINQDTQNSYNSVTPCSPPLLKKKRLEIKLLPQLSPNGLIL